MQIINNGMVYDNNGRMFQTQTLTHNKRSIPSIYLNFRFVNSLEFIFGSEVRCGSTVMTVTTVRDYSIHQFNMSGNMNEFQKVPTTKKSD